MTQQTSPFIETKWGWAFGESGWNGGMDENLLKFSFMFDRNVDGIVSTLPAVSNGAAYFLTTDNRLYFGVGGSYYSSPTPKWFEFKVRSTGVIYQFNGTSAVQIDNLENLSSRLSAVELTLSSIANIYSDLSSATGAGIVGYKHPATASVATTVQNKLSQTVSVKDFGAVGNNSADDTASLQAALDYIATFGGFQTTLGAVTGGYVSNVPTLIIPKGIYKISNTLTCPPYLNIIGENAVIVQTDTLKDILSGTDAYQWEVRGIHFSGGRCQANLLNNNLDVTRWTFEHCSFSLSSDFAIRTFPTAGAGSHLSANLTVYKCAFYKPKKVLLNYCDSARIVDSWVFVSKDNFSASTAVFENGSLTTDGHPNLYLENMFGVPAMGTYGVDRLSYVRWVDLYKGSIVARGCRFGGEFAGMPVVYNLAAPVTTYPFRGSSISLSDSECFGGPAYANDSAIIALQGQICQRISIRNCAGPSEIPYIINSGGGIADFATYFASFESASGQKAYSHFHFEIANNDSLNPNGAIYNERVPAGIRKFCNNMRITKVHRAATQAISNAGVNNYISFDTLDLDTQGGWDSTNPTRLLLPAGATRAQISIDLGMDGSFTGNMMNVRLENSSGTVVASSDLSTNSNADGPAYNLSMVVDGTPGEYFRLNVRTNATTAGNVIRCTAVINSLDYIG